MAYNGVEMPPEAFLVLEGSAVTNTPTSIMMPGGMMPVGMMPGMMPGGMMPGMMPGGMMPGGMIPGMVQDGLYSSTGSANSQ